MSRLNLKESTLAGSGQGVFLSSPRSDWSREEKTEAGFSRQVSAALRAMASVGKRMEKEKLPSSPSICRQVRR